MRASRILNSEDEDLHLGNNHAEVANEYSAAHAL